MDELTYEREYAARGYLAVAGVDEVGRGPLAGPVVCAAVILPLEEERRIVGINDSKKLSAKKREALFDIIKLSFNNLSLNIVDTDGRHVYVGSISSFQRRDSSEIYELPWFQDTLELYGKKVILPPRVPELNPQDGAVISLCRAFSPESTAKETAVLEMQVQYSYLTQKIEDAIHDQTGEKQVYIYNSGGSVDIQGGTFTAATVLRADVREDMYTDSTIVVSGGAS